MKQPIQFNGNTYDIIPVEAYVGSEYWVRENGRVIRQITSEEAKDGENTILKHLLGRLPAYSAELKEEQPIGFIITTQLPEEYRNESGCAPLVWLALGAISLGLGLIVFHFLTHLK